MPKLTFNNLSEEKKQRILDAAVEEFAYHSYNEVKLSRIIKESKIPRGSFYQYFEDKKDLYIYLFEIIKLKKIEYMSALLPNPENTPFLELFRQLYVQGLEFAVDNPKYVMITMYLINSRGSIYDEIIGDGLKLAKQWYISYIEEDKKRHRIAEDVDSDLLADLVIEAVTNIAYDQIKEGIDLDKSKMLKRVDGILKILRKGIE